MRNPIKTVVISVTTIATLVTSLSLVGCAHEVAHEKRTTVSPNGTVRQQERTVTENPDGTVTRKDEYKKVNP